MSAQITGQFSSIVVEAERDNRGHHHRLSSYPYGKPILSGSWFRLPIIPLQKVSKIFRRITSKHDIENVLLEAWGRQTRNVQILYAISQEPSGLCWAHSIRSEYFYCFKYTSNGQFKLFTSNRPIAITDCPKTRFVYAIGGVSARPQPSLLIFSLAMMFDCKLYQVLLIRLKKLGTRWSYFWRFQCSYCRISILYWSKVPL